MEDIDEAVEAKDLHRKSRNNMLVMSPEIVEEIVEEFSHNNNTSIVIQSRDQNDDVFVAVGKNDMDVVKWAVDNLIVSPLSKLYLVHIYPPITFIPTPVGKLARSQLTKDQVRFYVDEEENRRKNLLQKYIRLCNDAKVNVDTVLIEHHSTAKAIVDLIPFHYITKLVMGMKKLPNSRLFRTRMAISEYVKKHAPNFCEVSVVHDGKKYVGVEKATGTIHSSQAMSLGVSTRIIDRSQKKMFHFGCFSGKSLSA